MKDKIFLTVIILIGIVSNIFPQTLFRNGIFLLHSTGSCIYWSPDSLATTNIQLDIPTYNTLHNYTGDDAVTMDATYFPNNPLGNDWFEWYNIFDNNDPNNNIQPYLQNNKIIVIKSCYSSSLVVGEGSASDTLNPSLRTIYNYKWHWRSIIRVMQQHPENFFAIWTNAPLHATGFEAAERSHRFCKWAKDTLAAGLDATYGDFPSNVYVFDIFHKLVNEASNWALPDSMAYWNGNNYENHPGGRSTNIAAPLFVSEIFDAAIAYETTIPVELTSFTASIISTGVELIWSTATELNNDRFEIQKKTDNSEFITIGFVKGQGTSTQKNDYSFIDKNTTSGKYIYRLKQIDFSGNYEYSKELEVDFNYITTYALEQNYPNPFNPSTEINFTLANSGNVTLKVYNNLGSVVATLADGFMQSGKHSVKFNAKDFTSGVYFYRIETDNFTSTRKMLLIK